MRPIERVAAKLASLHPAWRETPWESIGSETRELFLVDARAVLQALREPSEGMVATVVQQVGDPSPEQWVIGERANATLTETNMLGETACAEVARDWQAMIDAALSE